ncbi:hypothetical protein LCGC14_0851900 [marine sediment metagenome]|uniref:Uncharacterized protein n=1 Tax=marine sediment metagenome TaxID=412755 RepID=A0A0F9SH26_9ZZZZ
MVQTQGQVQLRGENVERAIKGYAEQEYILKEVLLVQTSSKWIETYYEESSTVLTGGTGSAIQGVPRGAQFPYVQPNWTKKSAVHLKFPAEGVVFMEDKLTDAIDVQARTLKAVARAVASAVDGYIYTQLSGATGIGTAAAAGTGWDAVAESTRKPVSDILKGIQNMSENNYNVLQNGFLLLTPHDYRALMENSKVINNPSFKTADIVTNGTVGQIAGLKIKVTNSVTDDEAMIIMGQRAATWKSAQPLTSEIKNDPGIKVIIRAWEIGVIQITDPLGIYVITDTQES